MVITLFFFLIGHDIGCPPLGSGAHAAELNLSFFLLFFCLTLSLIIRLEAVSASVSFLLLDFTLSPGGITNGSGV
jgi:hypothetical protein